MAPIRPEDHAFVFQATVLVEIRRELSLSQAQLAELLDIPVNTLSRWERGSNIPDANALAALFSVAKERGVTPEFFKERSRAIMRRHSRKTLVVQWDYQNIAVNTNAIGRFISEVREYMRLLFPTLEDSTATAYISGWMNWDVSNALKRAGCEGKSDYYNADRQLIQDAETAFKLPQNQSSSVVLIPFHTTDPTRGFLLAADRQEIDPVEAVYVLISNDSDYADLLGRLKKAGAEVFVCGYTYCSERLIKTVGADHFIPWQRPYMVAKCYQVATNIAGKPITKSAFGNQCRVALEEDGWEGDEYEELLEDSGFSLNRPFASALQHMNTMGILRVKQAGNDPNRVNITIPGR